MAIGTGGRGTLLRAGVVASLLLGMTRLAGAAEECGTPVGGLVTCGPGSFPAGITYVGPYGGFDLTTLAGTDALFIDYDGDDGVVAVTNRGVVNSTGFGPVWGIDVLLNGGALQSATITNVNAINANIGVGITLTDFSSGSKLPVPLLIDNQGLIDAEGGGIRALVQNSITVLSSGSITTTSGHGIEVQDNTKQFNTIDVTVSGLVQGTKERRGGVYLHADNESFTGTVTISSRVDMNGAGAVGVWLVGGKEHVVKLQPGGVIEGGWGSGPKLEPSAGILLQTSDSNNYLTIDGSLRALSERAIADLFGSREEIVVGGALIGFVELGGGNDRMTMNNAAGGWALRNWADTDGDGNRDREAVARALFGDGDDLVDLTGGILGLVSLQPTGSVDASFQVFSPDGLGDIKGDGVEQGQLLGLETFRNAGVITMMDTEAGGKRPIPGDILVITQQDAIGRDKLQGGKGVYLSDGGELRLDTYLDSGLIDTTDLLIVDNTKIGRSGLPTRVFVANAGGPGGATGSGPTDGILVVQVLGSSDPGAFTLGAPVVAGAYQYDLNWADRQNWYLQSTLFEEVKTYPAAAVAAVTAWFADLRPLHERMGVAREQLRLADGAGQSAALGADDAGRQQAVLPGAGGRAVDAAWLRVTGDSMTIDSGASFQQTTVKGEAGYDVGFRDLMAGDDLLLLGGFGGLGQSAVEFDGDTTIDYEIYTAGLYATYGRGGFFVDTVVKGDWLEGAYNGISTAGADADFDAAVLGASVEIGWRQDLFGDAVFVEPQAQLSYAHNWTGAFDDAAGETVDLEDGDNLRGRLGGRIGTTVMAGRTRLGFYVEGNYLHDFFGTQAATVSGLTFKQDPAGNAIELGGGLRVVDGGGHLALFIDGDYVTGKDQEGVNLVAGLRISW